MEIQKFTGIYSKTFAFEALHTQAKKVIKSSLYCNKMDFCPSLFFLSWAPLSSCFHVCLMSVLRSLHQVFLGWHLFLVPSKGLPGVAGIEFPECVTDPSPFSSLDLLFHKLLAHSLPEITVPDSIWPVDVENPPQAVVDECLCFRDCNWLSSMSLIQRVILVWFWSWSVFVCWLISLRFKCSSVGWTKPLPYQF